jgi:hypothetical protein
MSQIKKAEIVNEKSVTKEDIVAEAKQIYARFGNIMQSVDNQDEYKKCFEIVHKEHPDFTKSYPIVVRYIVQFHLFDETVMTKFLQRIEAHPWKSEEDFIESHGDYVFMLWKKCFPEYTLAQLQEIRNNVVRELHAQHKKFKTSFKKVSAEIEKRSALADDIRGEEMLEFLESEELKKLLDRLNTPKDKLNLIVDDI